MKNFKIRGSACAQIMSNPRNKANREAGLLSETAKTYCREWLVKELYGKDKIISNKYLSKGVIMEDNSINFIAEQLGYGMLLKNEKHFENEFITGTPNIILKDLVINVKNSWNCFTFPLFANKINSNYYWQAQSYLALTGLENFKLIYVLSDTPEHLISAEVRKYAYQNGYDEVDVDFYEKFAQNITYKDVESKLRIKTYEITRNNANIERVIEQVGKCREYIKNLLKTI